MKGYGLPRNTDVAAPDKLDLINYARASHVGHLAEKSGEFKNSYRNPTAKRNLRRIFKRIARNAGKKDISRALSEAEDCSRD